MISNADCTIFRQRLNIDTRKNEWVKAIINNVYWQGSTGCKNDKSGMVQDNENIVFIPFSATDLAIKPEDKIFKGTTDKATPVGLDGALTITSVEIFDYGSADMQHFEVVAK